MDSAQNVTQEESEEEEEIECPEGMMPDPNPDECYLHKYDTLWKQGRVICELFLVFWSIVYLG